jgi:hypothetical protein
MALSIATVLLAILGVGQLLIGALLATYLTVCGATRPAALQRPFVEHVCLFDDNLLTDDLQVNTFVPARDGLDAVIYITNGVVVLLLLLGFRRQRRWAWIGLMAWSGLNLAVALYRYFSQQEGDWRVFGSLALYCLVVLALNMAEVQEAFGLRRPPSSVPLRRPSAPGGGEP